MADRTWTHTTYARPLALTWHDVALATSDDDSRPILTGVLVEHYAGRGVRLVASDSYSLLVGWVPDTEQALAEPGLDESPDDVLIAADTEGRMLALVRYLITATKKDEYRTVVVDVRDAESDTQDTLDPTWRRRALVVDADVERIFLPEIEGEFPEWRSLYDSFKPGNPSTLAVGPSVMAVIGKLRSVSDGEPVELRLGEPLRPVRVSAGPVYGLFMPVRMGTNLDGDEDES